MFKAGDIIVYGAQGICKIDCITTKQIGKQKADYYVLKPLYNENTAVFVPVKNKLLIDKMQNVLSKKQAEELINIMPQISVLKYTNESQKCEQYKEILTSGDREKLVSLIKTIRVDRELRREDGKKLNINDEQTLRKAEALFFNEMAFVYGVTPDEVQNMIVF